MEKQLISDEFMPICKVSEVPPGEMRVFNLNHIEVLIYNQNGDFKALYNKCPHMGGSLADGDIDTDGYVICPLHGWQFNPDTGKGPSGYDDSVPTFKVRVAADDVLISRKDINGLAANQHYLVLDDANSKERYERTHSRAEPELDSIAGAAKWGGHNIASMKTLKSTIGFDDILFKAAQLYTLPLLEHEAVNLQTTIGAKAKDPLSISLPVYVSHMSFGALSVEAKEALAAGAREVDTATCSGEGGSHPREFAAAGKYIYEIGTAAFTLREEWVKRADAVEIKIGQAAKPGLGGHLPKEKITDEISQLRGIPKGKDQISPARFAHISNRDDLRGFVAELRESVGDKPIGIKFAAGHVEQDLEVALYANPDFITIDGRGGGTGAAPVFIKDNFAMPIVFAIARARQYLDKHDQDVSLIATGGFRTAGDIAKVLAMGADAVAIATSAMMAIGCQQYRACHTGNCPVGIATQKYNLRERFDIEEASARLVNFFATLRHQLTEITQAVGKNDISQLNYSDIFTTNREISDYTPIEHA